MVKTRVNGHSLFCSAMAHLLLWNKLEERVISIIELWSYHTSLGLAKKDTVILMHFDWHCFFSPQLTEQPLSQLTDISNQIKFVLKYPVINGPDDLQMFYQKGFKELSPEEWPKELDERDPQIKFLHSIELFGATKRPEVFSHYFVRSLHRSNV